MFAQGLAYGLAVSALVFGLLWWSVRAFVRVRPRYPRLLWPVVNLARYLLLIGLVIIFLTFHLGSVIGLLVGLGAGSAGFLIWQGISARDRGSRRV